MLGILAVIGIVFVVGGVLGVIGLVLGVIGLARVRAGRATNRGVAMAGVVTSAIAVVATAAIVAAGASFFFSQKKEITDYQRCLNRATTQQQRQDCANQFKQSVNNR